MVGFRQLVVLQAFCYGALAQTTTTQLFVAGFDDTNSLSGAVIGTGSEGTTFILEGVDVLNTTTIPFTMTLVEGSQAMIETAVIPADDNFGALAACSFSGSGVSAAAVCAEIVQTGSSTISLINTFPLTSLNIPVSTDTPPPGFGPITVPGLSSVSSGSASAKSTITTVSATNTGPQSTVGPTTVTNGGVKRVSVVVGAVPAVMAFGMVFLALL